MLLIQAVSKRSIKYQHRKDLHVRLHPTTLVDRAHFSDKLQVQSHQLFLEMTLSRNRIFHKSIKVANCKRSQKLGTIGKGGSSKVFQAFDGKKICAIKYVNLEEADDFIVQSYINEVQLLERLQGNDNIIKLFDWELSQEKSCLILVMECGSIDLAGFLRKNRTKITEGELQVFWRQMLEAVHVIHEAPHHS
ncbi:hypothetical protein OS493_019677 [Desmophyllum pertusum]|uniref:Protein kinase domain-containing protein n=1 Tax=Desmophyllum pertusum TaxID=174260 RepID=A0A9W9Z227_9CNID|nr:hypothetical protein OS493_019677 [Desmophyllum pertusum]